MMAMGWKTEVERERNNVVVRKFLKHAGLDTKIDVPVAKHFGPQHTGSIMLNT
jgi:hypothetical protein